jgi:hypothetical protein
MIIQLLLIGVLLLSALVVVRQMQASRRARVIVLSMLAIGAYLVWQPEQANELAHSLGVGRGADLMLYLWIVLTFAVILLLYLKIVEMNQMVTDLARRLTLMTPVRPGGAGAGSAGWSEEKASLPARGLGTDNPAMALPRPDTSR